MGLDDVDDVGQLNFVGKVGRADFGSSQLVNIMVGSWAAEVESPPNIAPRHRLHPSSGLDR